MKIELATMEGGTINSISFYTTSDNIPTKTPGTVVVYVKEVGYTEINAFETKEGSSVIYQGKLNIISTTDSGLLTIPFNTPYNYAGGNLLIGIENTTDADINSIIFYGQTVKGASVAGADTESLANVTASQQNFIPKTTFEYTAFNGYHKPTGLAASEVTTETTTLSWTAPEGEVTGYVYQYKKANEETWSTEATVTTTTVTIGELTAATVYNFRVRALYGSNESYFAMTNFTTQISDDMCSITLKLTDHEGDGWNGAAIKVVDVLSGILIGTYTNKDLDGKKDYETNIHLVSVPNDRDINFVWVKGLYDSECAFLIYDVNCEVIYVREQDDSGTGPSAGVLKTYHADCKYTPNLSDLTGTPLRTVEVSPMGSVGFHEVTFDTPIEITPKENIWIVLTATGKYILPYCNGTEPNNQWIYDEGTWQHLGDINASLANRGWLIRGYFESTTDPESVKWTEGTSTSGSYTITGLTPETEYLVKVRGDYGSDGKSKWVTSHFTTPAANATAISWAAPDPSPKSEESIYTLDGVNLEKVSTRKGVYIQNKRKIVVK